MRMSDSITTGATSAKSNIEGHGEYLNEKSLVTANER